MSRHQLSHDECRSRVCVFCWEWAKRSMNHSEISILKQHVFPAYDPDSVRFPNGICSTCSRNLYRRRQWDFTRKFFPSTKLTQCINKAQRSGRICGCLICKTVRLNQVKYRCKWLMPGEGKELPPSQGQRGFV